MHHCHPTSVVLPRAAKAFTLIELLAVIVVIAILAVLAGPFARGMVAKANAAVSQSNMRQLYSFFQMYAADHNYALPIGSYRDASQLFAWDKSLAEYASNPQDFFKVLHSPADKVKRIWPDKNPRTYAMVRAGGYGAYSEYQRNIITRFTKVEKKAETLLLVEFAHPLNVVFGDSAAIIDTPNQQLEYGSTMYGGRFVYLFMDGHVEFLNPSQTTGTGSLAVPRGAWCITPPNVITN